MGKEYPLQNFCLTKCFKIRFETLLTLKIKKKRFVRYKYSTKVLRCQENDHCGIQYWLLKFDLIKLRKEVKDGGEVPLLHKHLYNSSRMHSSSSLFLSSLYSKLKIPKESVLFKKFNIVFMKDLVSKETV